MSFNPEQENSLLAKMENEGRLTHDFNVANNAPVVSEALLIDYMTENAEAFEEYEEAKEQLEKTTNLGEMLRVINGVSDDEVRKFLKTGILQKNILNAFMMNINPRSGESTFTAKSMVMYFGVNPTKENIFDFEAVINELCTMGIVGFGYLSDVGKGSLVYVSVESTKVYFYAAPKKSETLPNL